MGACTFHNAIPKSERIDTPLKAFNEVVDAALYDYGHSGYTGTIAEKTTFDVVKPNEGESIQECIERTSDDEFSDKWGPAGCIVTDEDYHFFGWASE